jgi:hypothetical protein
MNVNKRASRRSLRSDLGRVDAHVTKASEYKELPALTDQMLARAIINKGGRPRSANPPQGNFSASTRRRNRVMESDRAWLADTHGATFEQGATAKLAPSPMDLMWISGLTPPSTSKTIFNGNP